MKSGIKPGVTIYEIAKHVGVSPAAVSTTLANRHAERRLAAETVRKIREAATQLGYVPNMAGRRLRAHKAATRQYDLAILTSFEAPLPLVGQALHALESAVDAESNEHTRFAVAIEMFHAGRLAEKPGLLDANRYHGVILTNTLPNDDEFLANSKLPCAAVVLGRRIAGYCCVLEAPDRVGSSAAEVLLEAGSCRPAMLHGRQLTFATADRVAAFRRAVRARLGTEPVAIVSEGLLPAQAAAAMSRFFKSGNTCDGLFAVTDSMAIGAYRVIRGSGRNIPDDIAVVGVGDFGQEEYFDPPMTTVAGANETMVAEAVPLLFRLLRGDASAPGEVLVIPPVIARASTARRTLNAKNPPAPPR